mmetsp:Transcript_53705/g.109471  ORF Transcript_53705/g.109471 Transcript_53705/m.109471 type:complete len:236 (-) Transcript_53705:2861-3568(-)
MEAVEDPLAFGVAFIDHLAKLCQIVLELRKDLRRLWSMRVVEEQMLEVVHKLWCLHASQDRHQQPVVRGLHIADLSSWAKATRRKIRRDEVLCKVADDVVLPCHGEDEGSDLVDEFLCRDGVGWWETVVFKDTKPSVEVQKVLVVANVLIVRVVSFQVTIDKLVNDLVEVERIRSKRKPFFPKLLQHSNLAFGVFDCFVIATVAVRRHGKQKRIPHALEIERGRTMQQPVLCREK